MAVVSIPVNMPELRGEWEFLFTFDDPASELPTAVTVKAPPGQTISAPQWRSLRIGHALAAARRARTDPFGELVMSRLGPPPTRPHEDSKQYETRIRVHRNRVVLVYRYAVSRSMSDPAGAVARYFGVSASTASRWITDARKVGLLGNHREEVARWGNGEMFDIPDDDRAPRTARRRATRPERKSK